MSSQELLELQNQIIEQQNEVIRGLIEEISHYENFIMSDKTRESITEIDFLLLRLEGR